MLAARTGSAATTKLLLEHGADVNARELWREQTALMWAADGAFAELTQLLIDHGADVRARAAANDWGVQITSEPRAQYRPTGGMTPLLYAARSGCADCVRAILAAGEDIDRPTPDGVTALMIAIDNYEFDTAKALLDAGANPHYADWWGRTALYLAVDMNTYVPRTPAHPRSQETTGIDLVRQLLASGVDVDPQLNMHRPGRGGNSARFTDYLLTTGATPLLRAAITHDHEAMRLLLEHGADSRLAERHGRDAADGGRRPRRPQHQFRRQPLAGLRGRQSRSRAKPSRRSRSCSRRARTSIRESRTRRAARPASRGRAP